MSRADAVIIDSGGANLASLQFALERLGARCQVSCDSTVISNAPRVLLPGVGAAADAMRRLHSSGLDQLIPQLDQPLLGICLGMQLLFTHSEEGDTTGLGIIAGSVRLLHPAKERPVPHMGWNSLDILATDPLLKGINAADRVYFVHSYAAPLLPTTIASMQYGATLSAVVRQDNFCGVQFHPERSARAGAQLLRNFLEL